jgi:predicted dehydrogenase
MERIPLAIVGCGGMGTRHLFGLNELHQSGLSRFELIAACDPVTANAEKLADRAEGFFGKRPAVVSTLEEVQKLGVQAVDITTTPPYHHTLGIEALERGIHAMIEKPVGLTVRAGNLLRKAAEKSGCVVSTAENYRRDPINRLAKHLIDTGVIGTPRFMIHNTGGGGDRMTISVWRHQKDQSGVLLDVGVHFADMMEYFLGEIDTVYAHTRLHEPTRYNPVAEGHAPTSNPSGVYGEFQKAMPARFTATAEDAAYATLLFKNGAVGQYIEEHAVHGRPFWTREIHGSKGSMDLPNDRSGKNIVLTLIRNEVIDDERILDLAPDFQLDPVTADLFDGDRLWRYNFPFELTDRKLIAVEYADFAGAILGEHPVEVDATQGTRAVAVSYSMLESGAAGGRPVSVEDVMNEKIREYQREIDEGLGI